MDEFLTQDEVYHVTLGSRITLCASQIGRKFIIFGPLCHMSSWVSVEPLKDDVEIEVRQGRFQWDLNV